MLQTEYLFGREREAYEPHITIVAARRISDAKGLLKKLSKERDTTDNPEALLERYQAVEHALLHWQNIKDEK